MSDQSQPPSGTKFQQAMVDQKPRYENKVVTSRKLGIIRKDLRTRKKTRFL